MQTCDFVCSAMEERFLNQLENTFSYRRSPRIMEQTVTEQKTTMKRQKLRDDNKENSVFGELGNSPEGKEMISFKCWAVMCLIILTNYTFKCDVCFKYIFQL